MAEKAEAGDFVLYADAQATVEALQARVQELEARQHFGACAKCLTNAWRICKEGTPDAVEMKCSNGSTWWLCDYCLSKEQLTQRTAEVTQLQALVRALPDCPGEIKVYPPAVGVICGTYDVRYDFHLESGSFQSIRLAMFHDECEADTYADLLKYRATLDTTTPDSNQLGDINDMVSKGGDGE